MKIIIVVSIVIGTAILLFACSKVKQSELIVGGIYSIENGKGAFGVAKILVLDTDTVHIRLYKNTFTIRPKTIAPEQLTLGTIHDKDGSIGIGHLPIKKTEFKLWKPELILSTEVKDVELDGYKEWKNTGGGVWGK